MEVPHTHTHTKCVAPRSDDSMQHFGPSRPVFITYTNTHRDDRLQPSIYDAGHLPAYMPPVIYRVIFELDFGVGSTLNDHCADLRKYFHDLLTNRNGVCTPDL